MNALTNKKTIIEPKHSNMVSCGYCGSHQAMRLWVFEDLMVVVLLFGRIEKAQPLYITLVGCWPLRTFH